MERNLSSVVFCLCIKVRDDFWNGEIKLTDLHHPNVVAFYGVMLDSPRGSVETITKYMVNGSLRNDMQRNDRLCVYVFIIKSFSLKLKTRQGDLPLLQGPLKVCISVYQGHMGVSYALYAMLMQIYN
ncbi:uncharacterized protein LOC130738183 [Lotus japonicus]|uniref:uncharacterized protein LOC130738183 n=1 Tax=Lotus japonicus TaxID=34305 RepID=UPI00258E0C38|nr:uncharacterized protein LOC130738183 [Lotus japonicus]